MSNVSWGFIFVPPGLVLVFWLLRKLFPAPTKAEKPPQKPSVSIEKKKAFQNYDGYGVGLILFFCFVNAIILSWLFSRLGTMYNASRFPDATFALTVAWPFYLLPAFSPGLLLAYYIADRAFRVIVGNRNYQEYRDYSNYVTNKYYGINWKALVRPFVILVIVTTIIPWYILTNWYVLFTPEYIVIKPWFSITSSTHQYSDIESIRTAPAWISIDRKEIVPNRQYIIQFRNGDKWVTQGGLNFSKTYGSPARLTSEQMAQILGYVSRKAGVPITEMKILNLSEP